MKHGEGEGGARLAVAAWLLLVLALLALLLVLTNAPAGMQQPQGWAPIEGQSERVGSLYRHALHLPQLPHLTALWFSRLARAALALTALAYALLAAAMLRRSRLPTGPGLVIGIGAPLTVCLLMPPVFASDIFYYALTGEMVADGRGNPYVTAPAQGYAGPLLAFNRWGDYTSPYGPVWTDVSAAVAAVTGGAPFGTTFTFKLLGAVAVAAAAACIYYWGAAADSGGRLQGAVLFALNPVVLVEGVANGHQDGLVALLAVLAAAALLRGKGPLALFAAAGAVLIKATILPVFGLVALSMVRSGPLLTRLRRLTLLGVAALAAAALAYAPYWSGAGMFADLIAGRSRYLAGLGPVLAAHAASISGYERASGSVALAVSIGLMLLYAAWYVQRLVSVGVRGRVSSTTVVRDAGLAVLLLSFAFLSAFPWYVLPGLGTLAVNWPHHRRLTVSMCLLTTVWLLLQYLK